MFIYEVFIGVLWAIVSNIFISETEIYQALVELPQHKIPNYCGKYSDWNKKQTALEMRVYLYIFRRSGMDKWVEAKFEGLEVGWDSSVKRVCP